MPRPRKRARNSKMLGGCVFVVAIFCLNLVVTAQSGRSYSTAKPWWTAGRGIIFPLVEQYDNSTGELSVLNTGGAVQTHRHPFFESLGTNGRACITCHQPANAMSLSTATVRERWMTTQGKDPLFAAMDGSNCPNLPQAVEASHSLLLDRGLIRIALPWPPVSPSGRTIKPEFQIEVMEDPTGCNTSSVYGLKSSHPAISVYRRPRMVANLKFVRSSEAANLMADGREESLRSQAITAAVTHEQAVASPSEQDLAQIEAFENQIFVAQSADYRAGLLNEREGPAFLGPENVALGRAPLLNGDKSTADSLGLWRKDHHEQQTNQDAFRASISRGSEIFFLRSFRIRGVPFTRLSRLGDGSGTCATCHSNSLDSALEIGTTNTTSTDRSTDLPVFRITCDSPSAPRALLGRVIYSHDPGRALITGKCADVGAIVMQQLRGLSARAPYFANGSAKTLREVIDFYDRRFSIGYSEQEKQDLLNFLSVL